MAPKVAVTGLGVVTPCGVDLGSTWASVVAGRSPIRRIERFPLCGAATQIGGFVPGYEDKLPPDSLALAFARTAVREAVSHAGLTKSPELVVVGNHGERRLPSESGATVVLSADDFRRTLADELAVAESIAVFGACAAGGQAIALGSAAIQSGRAQVALCIGVDAMLNDFDFFQFVNLYAMSTRGCDPEAASCPFDARRDGFVLSEGAACLVLESVEHAKGRDAPVRAFLESVGLSQSAYHMIASPPDAVGPARAMQKALDDARLEPADIGYVNAHGTSTRDNDWCETLAIRKVFGPSADLLPVSSTKSVTGHLMAGAGALEAALSVMVLDQGVIPPTMNYAEPDPRCNLDYVPNEARSAAISHVLTNSFGFGGHNTTLIFGKP